MWKKEDAKPSESSAAASTAFGTTQSPDAPSSNSLPVSPRAAAGISRGIKIRGEVTGTDDLLVDGQVEGELNLTANSCLTIGRNGAVKADQTAREDIVSGKVEGTAPARHQLPIWR